MQQIGLSLLSWMVESEAARATVVRRGGLMFLLKTMQRHNNDRMVQCNATATLCWLVHNNSGEHTHRQAQNSPSNDTIRTVVVRTIDRFMDNPPILGNCICILSGLQPMEEGNVIQGVFDETEIIQLALIGMKCHRTVSKVQRN